ncbi:trihydroxytoluene oxygenase [Dactylonectria macrodidyma]|uniref:Trihydroxytoluene oxygenase n=1 Tax=Dactylonectria macrodidyma TaxID=307937 RepID=A0A9P9EQV8_9HYPO|nr:trihydroxytoluene oxygenase [Dactylonectria macrodidyma]
MPVDSAPEPNRGTAVPDHVAVGAEQQSLADWKKQKNIDATKKINLVRLAHMRYQHPDLDSITQFLQDFGMYVAKRTDSEVWFRGYGPDPYIYYATKGDKKFLGGAFIVESYQDLERAGALAGVQIEEMVDAPGKGYMVTLHDPERLPVCLMYGQDPVDGQEPAGKITANYEKEKPRIREFLRFKPGPAAVYKLGHYGLCVKDFEAQLDFYLTNFNLVPTDFLHVDLPDGTKKSVALFAHIDRGDDYVDHHTFFINSNKTSHVHHCSFEVHDYDTQMLGHQWLAQKGYKSVWGVGRHILGSQIFDYWWDPIGNMIEHYADGDLVNSKTPISYSPAGDESLAVWGPEVPKWFLE